MNQNKFKKIIVIFVVCMLVGIILILGVKSNDIKLYLLNKNYENTANNVQKIDEQSQKVNEEINQLEDKIQEDIVQGDKEIINQENTEAINNNPLTSILVLSNALDNFIYEFDKTIDVGQDNRFSLNKESEFNEFSYIERKVFSIFTTEIQSKTYAYFEFKGKVYIYKLGDQSLLNKNNLDEYIKIEDEKFRKEYGQRQ